MILLINGKNILKIQVIWSCQLREGKWRFLGISQLIGGEILNVVFPLGKAHLQPKIQPQHMLRMLVEKTVFLEKSRKMFLKLELKIKKLPC